MNARLPRRRGAALMMAILCLSTLAIVFASLARLAVAERAQTRAEERRLRAGWLAEAGLERAWAKYASSRDYRGETWELSAQTLRGRDAATIHIVVEPIAGEPRTFRATARADYPRDGTARARQTRSALFPSEISTRPGDRP